MFALAAGRESGALFVEAVEKEGRLAVGTVLIGQFDEGEYLMIPGAESS